MSSGEYPAKPTSRTFHGLWRIKSTRHGFGRLRWSLQKKGMPKESGKAREQGQKELVALRASICTVRFQQRPDATAKLAEFKALSYSDKDTAIKKFVGEEKLATMLGEDVPAPGAIDKCADAISDLSRR